MVVEVGVEPIMDMGLLSAMRIAMVIGIRPVVALDRVVLHLRLTLHIGKSSGNCVRILVLRVLFSGKVVKLIIL